ncbi:hypothetical protein [Sphingomonas sp. Leaf357]|uniref:hypothetical protein n=1 Tax=Sphingomonas sp. Leaf357 TaxID=1736350 RepID=UPI0012E2F4A2|nr:hypothetical protein [Sphingomonas sp. Leaf357]
MPRLWIAIAAVFVLWQTMTYRGLSSLAAEWQFNEFGFYHPALTFLVLVLILCSPLLLLRLVARRRRRREPVEPVSPLQRAIRVTSRLLATLIGAAVAAVLAAIFIAAFTLFLPRDNGPPHHISANDDLTVPALGPAEIRGRVLYDSTAVFNEDFRIGHSDTRFAPMVGDTGDRTAIRYFVELPAYGLPDRQDLISVHRGVLREGGLPGELINLYRYAGFRIAPRYYVLYASGSSMRRSYLVTAAELVVLALFIALVGALYAYRRRRLRRLQEEPEAVEPEVV